MTRYPFSSLQSFSRLFSDYIEQPGELASRFVALGSDLDAVAEDVAGWHADRSKLAAILRRQASGWNLGEASEPLIKRLEDPSSVAVVTGQQLGLFTGPLYTLYKTLSTIRIAGQLNRDAIPVFWLEGEDHDFAEVDHIGLLDGDEAVRLTYQAEPTNHPVGRMLIGDAIHLTLDRLEAILQTTDFSADLMAAVREAYAPGVTFTDAFVRLMTHLIGSGAVLFITPDDPELKKLGSDVFRREIEDFAGTSERLARASDQLVEAGYHAQVQTRPTNLFLLTDAGRSAIDVQDDSFVVRSEERTISREDLLELLDNEPERFSPNVVLRPLLQDRILPTAVYVAGPGEVAYFAQFRELYEWAGLQMPVIAPRASLTLIESRIDRILKKHELGVADFEDQVERLFRRTILDELDVDLNEAFANAGKNLHTAVNEIKPVIEGVDRSLIKSAEALRASLMKEWKKLEDRVIRSEKDRHDVERAKFDRASTFLFPFAAAQERGLSPLYFLNKYGPNLVERLLSEMDAPSTSHQIIHL